MPRLEAALDAAVRIDGAEIGGGGGAIVVVVVVVAGAGAGAGAGFVQGVKVGGGSEGILGRAAVTSCCHWDRWPVRI